jgi:DNA-binding GntR family transcriptional regulator
MARLTRATLAEQAYEELHSQIVSGRRPAGQRLLVERLADELAISQTPVKEALALLERDGLVQGSSRKASAVRRFTREDILQIYEARILIELKAIAAGKRTKGFTPQFFAELERAHAAQKAHAERRTREDLAEALRYDRAFHECIVSLTQNYLMIGWHRTILHQTQSIRTHSLETYKTPRSWQDHEAILNALKRGDVAGASRELRNHLAGSCEQLASRPREDLPEIS